MSKEISVIENGDAQHNVEDDNKENVNNKRKNNDDSGNVENVKKMKDADSAAMEEDSEIDITEKDKDHSPSTVTSTDTMLTGEKNEVEIEEGFSMEEMEMKRSAYTLLAQGNKMALVQDYPEAEKLLGEACHKFVRLYGEMAPECAAVFLSYGSVCLEIGKEQATLLDVGTNSENDGTALSEAKENQNEDVADKKEVTAKAEEAQQKEQETKVETTTTDDNEQEVEEDEEKDVEVDQDETIDAEVAETVDEEDDMFQVAWENLECAKIIYTVGDDLGKLSDCYLKLGEVSMMTGNYEVAIEDINMSLKMRKAISNPDSREVAEIHFKLALCYNLNNQFEEAVTELQKSGDILRLRISTLKKNEEEAKKEIDEIESVLAEIEEKLAEVNSAKLETFHTVSDLLKSEKDELGGASCSSSSKDESQANDINHLIRKKDSKRKVAQDQQQDDKEKNKKLRVSDAKFDENNKNKDGVSE